MVHMNQNKVMSEKLGLLGLMGMGVDTNAGDMNMNGHGFAFGGNIALHAQFNEKWSAGLTYRAPMSLKVNGKARWGNPMTAGLTSAALNNITDPLMGAGHAMATATNKNKVRGTIHLPDSYLL